MALTNCAKMGLSMSDARSLSWWEYQALLHGHQPDDAEEPAEAPAADFVNSRMERLGALGIARVLH